MKKIVALTAAMVMAVSISACGGSSSSTPATQAPAQTEAAASAEAAGDIAEIEAGSFETPIVLTSIGQSADVDIVNTLCGKAGIEVTLDGQVSADTLPADCKTLIFAVGGSSKGLGAAGIDADQELARTKALIEKAKGQGTKIIAMHTGGSARRGTLSDSFIVPAFEGADAAIVVTEGDGDGLMKGIIANKGIQATYIDQIAGALAVLQTAFGK